MELNDEGAHVEAEARRIIDAHAGFYLTIFEELECLS